MISSVYLVYILYIQEDEKKSSRKSASNLKPCDHESDALRYTNFVWCSFLRTNITLNQQMQENLINIIVYMLF